MKKVLIILLVAVLVLSAVGCSQTPPNVPDVPNVPENTDDTNDTNDTDVQNVPIVPDDTDNQAEPNGTEGQLLDYDNYEEILADIYLCDDVYRGKDTPTHGTASIRLPMAQDVLELKDYDILLCCDGCDPAAVVSRASQGYAPVYRIVSDGEIDGNSKVLKFKMEIPEPMLEDIKKQGAYEQITEQLESKYFYLLVLDEKHYAYIHLERIEGAEKIESEAELADSIVKNARIIFEPDNEKINLTIERVIRLAENKGENLTWSDFEMYSGRDIGSGLYILNYEIDETFDLMVGGVPGSEPMYIRLVTKADRDNYIDIRTEDVEKFISENRDAASSTGVPGTNDIDWEAIDGEWYYGFTDANGHQFYRLVFDMKTTAMNFDYGYYESEYVNRYIGTFTIDPVSQEITAVLHDDSIVHTDLDILMKFRLSTTENSDEATLVWKVLSCDVEKYSSLIGTDIEFTRNMPSIIELSAVADGEFKIYTIPQDGDNFLVLKIPETWYHDGEYFAEDYNGASAYPTTKRVAYRKTEQTLQEFTDELRATEPAYTQYDIDSPINGKNDAGYTYVGYYGDGEQIKGLPYRRYLFYITTDLEAYILEVWQYSDLDGDDFVEKILQSLLNSFAINTKTTKLVTLTSEDAVALLKEQLIAAYENTYGEFTPSDEEPSTFTGDKERLSYIIPRLTIKEETDQYYIISVIWDFYVDKETREIFKYYDGLDDMFIPFDPQSDTALSFAG